MARVKCKCGRQCDALRDTCPYCGERLPGDAEEREALQVLENLEKSRSARSWFFNIGVGLIVVLPLVPFFFNKLPEVTTSLLVMIFGPVLTGMGCVVAAIVSRLRANAEIDAMGERLSEYRKRKQEQQQS